jgi:hypothetical protein
MHALLAPEHLANRFKDASLSRPLRVRRIEFSVHREFLVCKSAMLFGKITVCPKGILCSVWQRA